MKKHIQGQRAEEKTREAIISLSADIEETRETLRSQLRQLDGLLGNRKVQPKRSKTSADRRGHGEVMAMLKSLFEKEPDREFTVPEICAATKLPTPNVQATLSRLVKVMGAVDRPRRGIYRLKPPETPIATPGKRFVIPKRGSPSG